MPSEYSFRTVFAGYKLRNPVAFTLTALPARVNDHVSEGKTILGRATRLMVGRIMLVPYWVVSERNCCLYSAVIDLYRHIKTYVIASVLGIKVI